MPADNIYWLFGSAAQAIAALVAFLIAGMALVQAMMQQAQQRDDTLADIHNRLQSTYYRWLSILAIGTGLAIASSLAMVFANAYSYPGKDWLVAIVSLIDLVVLGGAIAFVLGIVDPNRYAATATRIIDEDREKLHLPPPTVTDQEFALAFIALEGAIRALLNRKHLYVSGEVRPGMPFSFRQMIDALLRKELITGDLYEDLRQLNRYRNLVFHGHPHRTDKSMLDRVRAATQAIHDISRKKTRRQTGRPQARRRKPHGQGPRR